MQKIDPLFEVVWYLFEPEDVEGKACRFFQVACGKYSAKMEQV